MKLQVDPAGQASYHVGSSSQPAADGRGPKNDPLKVVVVDDDPSIRKALKRLMSSVDLPCETFGSASEFLAGATADLNEGSIGCLLLDVRMPGVSGLDLQRTLNSQAHDFSIIFVTAHADVPLTVRAMKAGAVEVFTKPFEDQALLDAVHQALGQARERRVQREELQRCRERFGSLTAREREVMRLVAAGLPNKQVADVLGTAEKTVKVHRGQVMHKMLAESFADLVRMADRLGLSKR